MARLRDIAFGRLVALAAGGCCFLSVALGTFVLVHVCLRAKGVERAKLGSAGLILLALGGAAGVMAVRFWKSPLPGAPIQPLAPEHMWALEDLRRDLEATDVWPKGKAGLFWWNQAERTFADKPAAGVVELQKLTAEHPGSLRFCRALIVDLLAAERWDEAKEEIARISRLPLGEGTPTLLWWLWIENVAAKGGATALEAAVGECLWKLPARGRPLVLDHAACLCFVRPVGAQWIGLADRFSGEAFQLAPLVATIRGTRGSVLAELGRMEEAEALLLPVFEGSAGGLNRGFSALYLAIIAGRRGQQQKALRLAKEARRYEPVGFVDDRLKADGL
ncbi:MAG: tetratricopeptide repeat protein [Verrucomicrobia bacterium]|nr:tetratricopeptide repeat protein [Verrucomicrobiota bacterium]